MLASALTFANPVDAEVPRWCATIGGEAAANSPSCQEPTGPCAQLAAKARKLTGAWLAGQNVTRSSGIRANTQMRNGVPRIIASYEKKPAARVGGEDAKARTLERLWTLYHRERAKLDHAEAEIAYAITGYRTLIARMKREGCDTPYTNDWQDPMLSG